MRKLEAPNATTATRQSTGASTERATKVRPQRSSNGRAIRSAESPRVDPELRERCAASRPPLQSAMPLAGRLCDRAAWRR
jgi:hypothetical protein